MKKNKYKENISYDHLDQQQSQQSESQQQLYNRDFCTDNNNNINLLQYLPLNDNNDIFNPIRQHDLIINNLLTPFHPLPNNNNSYLNHPLFDINHKNDINNDSINFIPSTITANTNTTINTNNSTITITNNNNNNIQSSEIFQQHYNIINSLFIPISPLSSSHSSPPSLNEINDNKNINNNFQLIKVDNNNNNNNDNNNDNNNNDNNNNNNNKHIKKKKAKNKKWDQIKKMIDYFTQSMLPIKINDTIDSTCFLDLVMEKARKHWCCIGFKVAPITIDLIKNWRNAPETIIYCIASIALVTIMDHQATEGYVKNAAMAFYEQATQKIDTFIFDDDDDENYYYHYNKKKNNYNDTDHNHEEKRQKKKAMTIQSYFCLSYTSNLLRLYEQQRTWGGLASVALQLKTNDANSGCRPMNQAILLCWCRWYYIDAWLSLTLQRECLLPDQPPTYILNAIQQAQYDSTLNYEHQSLFQFTMLTRFMRKYIQVIQNKQLLDPITLRPTFNYYKITGELKQWYDQLSLPNSFPPPSPSTATKEDNQHQSRLQVHLHLCYHAVRLVVLYKFLSQEKPPQDDHLLMDGLETNLNLLQSLQQLASQGCDQSTYHHMFFAIHNTAARIYQYKTTWQKWAKEQLQMNLILLKSTQAYVNDVFQMRTYAEKIEQQFEKMGLTVSNYYKNTLHSIQQLQELKQAEQKEKLLEKILIHLSRRKKRKKKGEISDHLTQEEEVALLLNQYLKKQYQTVLSSSSSSTTTKASSTVSTSSSVPSTIPGVHVYKLSVNSTIRRPGLQKNNKLRCEKKKKKK